MSTNASSQRSQTPKRKLDSFSDLSSSTYLPQHSAPKHPSKPNTHRSSGGDTTTLKRQKTAPAPSDSKTQVNMNRVHGLQQRSQGFKGFATSNYQSSTGAKVLTVTNLRKGPRIDTHEYYERTWNQLEACLVDIFAGRQPQQSLEQLYKGVQDICRRGAADKLYQKLRDRCGSYLMDEVLPILNTMRSRSTNIDTLRHVYSYWQEFHKQMVGLGFCIMARFRS